MTGNNLALFMKSVATIKTFPSRSFSSLTCAVILTVLLPWSLTRHDYHDKTGPRGASLEHSTIPSPQWCSLCFCSIFPAFDLTPLHHHIAWLATRLTSNHQLIYEIQIALGPQHCPSRTAAPHPPSVLWLRWVPAGGYYFGLCLFYIVDNGRYWPIPKAPILTCSSWISHTSSSAIITRIYFPQCILLDILHTLSL